MDQWIWPAVAIDRRAAGFDEAHVPIETDRLRVLRVDIGSELGVFGERVLQQHAAHAGTARSGVDEQGFHVAAIHQHEANRAILGIGGDPQRRLRQESGYFGIDGLAVIGTEEIVGGIDRAAPEIDQGSAFVGAGGT